MNDSGEEEHRAGDAEAEDERFAETSSAEAPAGEREEDEGDEQSDHCGQRKSVRPFSSRVVAKAKTFPLTAGNVVIDRVMNACGSSGIDSPSMTTGAGVSFGLMMKSFVSR